MSNVKTFCIKTTEVTKNILSKTKKSFVATGNKIVDHLTPKRDYSYLPEEEAAAMHKMDRAETIDGICWCSFYIAYYLILIAYCIKQAKNAEDISIDV